MHGKRHFGWAVAVLAGLLLVAIAPPAQAEIGKDWVQATAGVPCAAENRQ